jgi:hypothetical protein
VAQLFSLGHKTHHTFMKTQTIILIVSLTIIGILGSCLGYEIVQNHKVEKGWQQIFLAVSVQSYQGLEHGDADAVKRRLGAIVKAQSEYYEQKYGHETGTDFASRLAEAKVIRDEVAAK